MKSWSRPNSPRGKHYFDLKQDHIVVGSHLGSPHSENAGRCSHAEFLAGRFHSHIRNIFGLEVLAEAMRCLGSTALDAELNEVTLAKAWPNPTRREEVAGLLAALDASPADFLEARLTDNTTRDTWRRVVAALPEHELPLLLALLEGDVAEAQRAAVQGLAQLEAGCAELWARLGREPRLDHILLKTLRNTADPTPEQIEAVCRCAANASLRPRALKALRSMEAQGQAVVSAATEGLHDARALVVDHAIALLVAAGADAASARPELAALLRNVEHQAAALEVLRAMLPPNAMLRELVGALTSQHVASPTDLVQGAVAGAIERDASHVGEVLRAMLDDGDPALRERALWVAADLPKAVALRVYGRAIVDPHPSVRAAAVRGLGRLRAGPEAVLGAAAQEAQIADRSVARARPSAWADTSVYLLERGRGAPVGVDRIGGAPPGLPADQWPTDQDGRPYVCLLTVGLQGRDLPGFDGAAAVAVFVDDPGKVPIEPFDRRIVLRRLTAEQLDADPTPLPPRGLAPRQLEVTRLGRLSSEGGQVRWSVDEAYSKELSDTVQATKTPRHAAAKVIQSALRRLEITSYLGGVHTNPSAGGPPDHGAGTFLLRAAERLFSPAPNFAGGGFLFVHTLTAWAEQ